MSLTVSNIKARDVHTSKQSFVVRKSFASKQPAGNHLASVHVVPLHLTKTNAVEVLLMRFPATHEHWPGMWHVPGYEVHSEDPENLQTVHDRVFGAMVRGLAVTITPVKTEVSLHYTPRGKEVGHVHFAEVFGLPNTGKFFDMRDLPQDIPEQHLTFIKRAASAYRLLYS